VSQAHPCDTIPTPSEASERSFSFCAGDHSTDSEEETIYEDVAPRVDQCSQNIESREDREENIGSMSEEYSVEPVFAMMETKSVSYATRFSECAHRNSQPSRTFNIKLSLLLQFFEEMNGKTYTNLLTITRELLY